MEFGDLDDVVRAIGPMDPTQESLAGRLEKEIFAGTMKSGVGFLSLTEGANALVLGVLGVVAEDEADRIRTRIKDALAAKKARGEPLGKPENLRPGAGQKAAVEAVRSRRQYNAVLVQEVVCSRYRAGESLRSIAKHLMSAGVMTAAGKDRWYPAQVQRVIAEAC